MGAHHETGTIHQAINSRVPSLWNVWICAWKDSGHGFSKDAFMMNVLIFAAAMCGKVQLINQSGRAWDAMDMQVLKYNEHSCKRVYGISAPCMLKFIKRPAQNDYNIICGIGGSAI